jgi:hypothetical protein
MSKASKLLVGIAMLCYLMIVPGLVPAQLASEDNLTVMDNLPASQIPETYNDVTVLATDGYNDTVIQNHQDPPPYNDTGASGQIDYNISDEGRPWKFNCCNIVVAADETKIEVCECLPGDMMGKAKCDRIEIC